MTVYWLRKMIGTYLVFSRENGFLHIYLSRNGTPWHHSRISLWGRRKRAKYDAWVGNGCVCDACMPTKATP